MGYSITHSDELLLVEGTKRRIGMGNARMRRFMGNMVYLRLTGKSRRMEANRRGPRYPLSRFSSSRHFCEPRRVKSSRILTKKAPTTCNIPRWILTRCQGKEPRSCETAARILRRPRASCGLSWNQDDNRINIKTVNLDAHNAALCHADKDTLLPGCCCLQSHNRARRVMAINEIASEVGYNSWEPT